MVESSINICRTTTGKHGIPWHCDPRDSELNLLLHGRRAARRAQVAPQFERLRNSRMLPGAPESRKSASSSPKPKHSPPAQEGQSPVVEDAELKNEGEREPSPSVSTG